jgi:hypothetical protein
LDEDSWALSFSICQREELTRMRHLLNTALVVSLLCASSVAQTTQASSPKTGDIYAQKPGAGHEITHQQKQAISVVNNAIATINQIHSAPSKSDRLDLIQDSKTFETSLGMLARADFERAMKLALAITQSDVSALAQLAVCRGVTVAPQN